MFCVFSLIFLVSRKTRNANLLKSTRRGLSLGLSTQRETVGSDVYRVQKRLTGTCTLETSFLIFGLSLKLHKNSIFFSLLSKVKIQAKLFSVFVPDRLIEIFLISTAMTLSFMFSRPMLFRTGVILCVCLSRVSSSLQEPLDWRSRLEIGRDPGWRAVMSAETAMHPAVEYPGDTFLPTMIGAHQKFFVS